MGDEWGPWIEHDGQGCPVPPRTWGRMVGYSHPDSIYESGESEVEGYIDEAGRAWDWSNYGKTSGNSRVGKVIRYRIRKPKGLIALEEIAADPEKELEIA